MSGSAENKLQHIERMKVQARDILDCLPEQIHSGNQQHFLQLIQSLQIFHIELEMQNDELLRSYRELEKSRDELRYLYETTPVGYLWLTAEGRIVQANQQAAVLLSCDTDRLVDQFLVTYVDEADKTQLILRYKAFFKKPEGKIFNLKVRDRRQYLSIRAQKYSFQERDDLLLAAMLDVTDLQVRIMDAALAGRPDLETFGDSGKDPTADHHILQLAHFDPLTQLPNRALFHDRLQHAFSCARRNDTGLAVLFLDLDHFKFINDTHGHDIGDQLLCQVAKRLQESLRSSDSVARLGGDEFIILLEDTKTEKQIELEAELVAKKILHHLSLPFKISEHELSISVSIGIALFPGQGDTPEGLIKHADMAMYKTKEQGRGGYHFCSSVMLRRQQEKIEFRQNFDNSVFNAEFALYYQPRVCLNSSAIDGFEALVRWRHPTRGLQMPQQFISFAEETGLIRKLGDWILAQACYQLALWRRKGAKELTVSVNLAAQQLIDPQFPDKIGRYLEFYKLPPTALELEITETAMIRNIVQTRVNLEKIHDFGVIISLDDFGVGYSSLTHVKNFPVGVIKIDQSFVRGIIEDCCDQSIVQSCISLAAPLGIKTVAEGVENSRQADFLRQAGCDFAQGFYFSRPVPHQDAENLLKSASRFH